MQTLLKFALDPVDQDTERVLLQKAKDKGEESDAAVDTLLRSNIKLLYKLAREFQPCPLTVEDLVMEGSTGLTYAISKFDLERDVRFISYACWWIRQKMRLAIQKQGATIRLPGKLMVDRAKLLRLKDELQQELGHEPSTKELAYYSEFEEPQIRALLYVPGYDARLDINEDEGEELNFEDLNLEEFESNLDSNETMKALKGSWDKLTPRQKYILTLRYGLDGRAPMILEEVAQEVGRTRERCRQIQLEALAQLRRGLKRKGIEE